jgi:hypothetical protein
MCMAILTGTSFPTAASTDGIHYLRALRTPCQQLAIVYIVYGLFFFALPCEHDACGSCSLALPDLHKHVNESIMNIE